MGSGRPNVLLLVIDALRADHVAPYDDAADTPEMASFAEGATVFERALSTAPWTLPSVTSILTGLYPHEHGVNSRRFETRRGRTIQSDLSAAGYHCLHVSPKTWLGEWLPQGRGFDRVVEFTGPHHRRFDGGEDVRRLSEGVARGWEWYATVVRRALAVDAPLRSLANAAAYKAAEATGDAWLDDVRASERAARLLDERLASVPEPFFAYVHLMDPHLPLYVPDEFRSSVRPPGCETLAEERDYQRSLLDDVWRIRLGERRLSKDERRFLGARYRDAVAYADSVVGRLLDSLAGHGLADGTLVVLTADHGEHLGEEADGRTLVDHQASVRLPVLRVPLLVRYPGEFEADERGTLVQTNFVAETIRALAGLEHDRSRSLLREDDGVRRETALAEYAGVVASHPPADVPTEPLFRTRRTAVAGNWKLDRVGGEPRERRVDWSANADPVVPDGIPADVRERLADSIPEGGFEAGDREVPSGVESTLRDLGYL